MAPADTAVQSDLELQVTEVLRATPPRTKNDATAEVTSGVRVGRRTALPLLQAVKH
jgi:hypothetical protein